MIQLIYFLSVVASFCLGSWMRSVIKNEKIRDLKIHICTLESTVSYHEHEERRIKDVMSNKVAFVINMMATRMSADQRQTVYHWMQSYSNIPDKNEPAINPQPSTEGC